MTHPGGWGRCLSTSAISTPPPLFRAGGGEYRFAGRRTSWGVAAAAANLRQSARRSGGASTAYGGPPEDQPGVLKSPAPVALHALRQRSGPRVAAFVGFARMPRRSSWWAITAV